MVDLGLRFFRIGVSYSAQGGGKPPRPNPPSQITFPSPMHPLPTLLYLVLWASVLGCTTPATEPANAGLDMAPLATGNYSIYDVTEQRFSLTAPPATSTYQVKETTGPAYTDITRQTAYRLQRFRRADARAPWQPDSVWTARTDGRQLVRTENGADFVKLTFPLANRSRWNGNRLNRFAEDFYELQRVDEPFRVGNQTFAQTATVVQQNDSTLVSQDRRVEVYARLVGLVYKEVIYLQFCSSAPTCVGKAQIDFGTRRYYRLNSYGTE